ncbi:hypothetical protein G6F50_016985 [Rhizopus delemar]|uniref:Uncharacterized protein n=1 Tax=Rhizopus delemar TaxID=936053 RepID=A0A9P7C0X7_9FUNG|nr:hypothetical protein G6F50_016985 [Rhizopus delemar]
MAYSLPIGWMLPTPLTRLIWSSMRASMKLATSKLSMLPSSLVNDSTSKIEPLDLVMLVLNLYLRRIRIGAGGEHQVDLRRAIGSTGGGHVHQVVQALLGLLDDLGDRVFHGLRRSAGVGGADGDGSQAGRAG